MERTNTYYIHITLWKTAQWKTSAHRAEKVRVLEIAVLAIVLITRQFQYLLS